MEDDIIKIVVTGAGEKDANTEFIESGKRYSYL